MTIENPIESEISIDTNDIYKDLRIMGYDYGPLFRGLRILKPKTFRHSTVPFNGMEIGLHLWTHCLQTMAVAMPFRKMMVPVMIKSLKCDPKVLYEAVAKNKIRIDTRSQRK